MKSAKDRSQTAARRRGRPLSFDRDLAAQRAMLLFWEHGYEATSLNDLTSALGVTPSSVYTAFGDKKGLFLAALRQYLNGPVRSDVIIAAAASPQQAAEGLLRAAAIGFTGATTPRGCLLASSAISCSAEAYDVKETLARLRKEIEVQLCEKIQHGIQAGQLPADTHAGALAAHTMAVIQGMSTLARDGASRASLLRVVKTAMQCWPTRSPPSKRI